MAFPKNENILTNNAHDAVAPVVNSPVLAMSTAPKESPEKKPGKKTSHARNRIEEFRTLEAIKVEFKKTFNWKTCDI